MACSVVHASVEALKRYLVREWAKIPQEHYRAAVDKFQRRLDMVIDVKGDHIEEAIDFFKAFPVCAQL